MYYDELDFVNGALGGIGGSFVYRRLLGVPLMTSPYIGALKSYLYYPIFQLAGVSALTIRLPVILLSAGSLLVFYRVAGLLLRSRTYQVLFMLLAATDVDFVFQSKIDWGPIVIQQFLMSLALLFFWRSVQDTADRAVKTWLPCLYGVLLLGLYNKLNFVWLVGGLGAAFIVCHVGRVRQWVHYRLFWIWLSLFLVPFSVISALLIIPAQSVVQTRSLPLMQRLDYVRHLYATTMNGSAVFGFITGRVLPGGGTWINLANVVVLFFWLGLAVVSYARWRTVPYGRELATIMSIFVVVFAEIVATPQATGPHHVIILWPLNIMILLLMLRSAGVVITRAVNLPESVSGSLACVLIVAVAVSNVSVYTRYADALSSNRVKFDWNMAIYGLSRYVNQQSRNVNYILFEDWGIANQVFALASSNVERAKIRDYWPLFEGRETSAHLEAQQSVYDAIFLHERVLVPIYSEPNEVMPGSRANFVAFVKRFHLKMMRVKVIRGAGRDTGAVFDVFLVTSAS